jgi:hypothetical protein
MGCLHPRTRPSYSKQFTAVLPASDNTFIANTIKLLFHGLLPAAQKKSADVTKERGVLCG